MGEGEKKKDITGADETENWGHVRVNGKKGEGARCSSGPSGVLGKYVVPKTKERPRGTENNNTKTAKEHKRGQKSPAHQAKQGRSRPKLRARGGGGPNKPRFDQAPMGEKRNQRAATLHTKRGDFPFSK